LARYFIRCAYIGTAYNGWQIQPHVGTKTIQGIIQDALSLLTRERTEIVGCGRTDAGVHAQDYVAHFDCESSIDLDLIHYKINKILPLDISVQEIVPVSAQAHARFDATSRSYKYKIHIIKDPFANQSFYYRYAESISLDALNTAATLLTHYSEFLPFCKTNGDNKSFTCHIKEAHWMQDGPYFVFDITADRFLRGMIRLVVGMCLNVARGRLLIDDVKHALDHQIRLKEDWSVDAHGLVLRDIIYPYPLWRD
jgi:tRNA pseudouridine38-40 synthase